MFAEVMSRLGGRESRGVIVIEPCLIEKIRDCHGFLTVNATS